MSSSLSKPLIGKAERAFLLLAAIALAILLFFLRGMVDSKAPLDQLARKSIDPDFAIANGRPTVLEFYADWCEACREMAPKMLAIENQIGNKLDIVLLNVDNMQWQDLIEKYEVYGIPQLDFFDANGQELGTSIGAKNLEQLNQLIDATLNNKKISSDIDLGKTSALKTGLNKNYQIDSEEINISPRSHG